MLKGKSLFLYHALVRALSGCRIIELLMQLFWKQNRYAFNNFQYGHKQPENITYLYRETTTPARDKSLSVKPTTSMAQALDPARCKSL